MSRPTGTVRSPPGSVRCKNSPVTAVPSESEFALVGENRASCLVCGTTRPWEAVL